MADVPVQFTDDIPKIEREGAGQRSSKYDELLDACVKNAGKAAKITVEKQGQASSRATSIRTAADNHDMERNEEGAFIVATRSGKNDAGDDEFYVYVKYVEAGTDEYDEELKRRTERAERAKKRASEDGDTKPRARKATKKVAKSA